MKGLAFSGAAVVAAAALLLSATPAAASDGARYIGTEYDQGGTTQPIDGPVPSMNNLANQITSSTSKMLAGLAKERATLPYGRLDGASAGMPRQLSTYPAPAGSPQSDQYSVTVRQGRRAASSFVYQVAARKATNLEQDTSWTSFSFAGRVQVSVRKLAGDATGCLVRPEAPRIATTFSDNTCTFTLTHAANVSVEFAPDTTNPVLHPMLVFANPPETDVPPANAPDVLYIGPGFHYLGSGIQLHSNETVYIAGGAWVQAAFIGNGVHNVVIRGRGIIDGSFLDTGNQTLNKNQPGLIDIDCHVPPDTPQSPCDAGAQSSNIVVDGLTLVDAPRFNVRVLGDHITIDNIKAISWWYNTDCIWAGNSSLVQGNFCKVNDDSLKPMSGPAVIRDNVVWQLENGAPFMISWNIVASQSDFRIYDNDVIHAEQNSAEAIFRAQHGGAATMQRYLFQNIRVEDADQALFDIILEHNRWYDPTLGYGQISDLIFRNVTATTSSPRSNVLAGVDPLNRVSDVDIADVSVNGTCLASAADGNFAIDPATTTQIRIMKSSARPCGGTR
jgi:glycosyl hydrolase family 28